MLVIKSCRSFEFGPVKLEFVIKEGSKTLLFPLDKVKASQATQEEGLLWIDLAEVFENGIGSALYGKDAEDFENHLGHLLITPVIVGV